MAKKEQYPKAFAALVKGVRERLEGASEYTLKNTPGAIVRESIAGVLSTLRIDLSAVTECGEPNTLLSTCTKITTNTSPCDKTKPVEAGGHVVSIDLQELVEGVRNEVIREMELAPEELSAIGVNLKIELSQLAKCGESNTLLSTCTKITTSTTPCCKTDKNSSTKAAIPGAEVTPIDVIDLGAITYEVRERLG